LQTEFQTKSHLYQTLFTVAVVVLPQILKQSLNTSNIISKSTGNSKTYLFQLTKHSVELNTQPEVKTAAALFQQLCYNNKNALQAGIIVGGWDPRNGGSVFNIPLGGSLHKQPWAIGGSGSTYIFGYCDSNFKVGMTRDECRNFVINGKDDFEYSKLKFKKH
jgi:hypothetical protein